MGKEVNPTPHVGEHGGVRSAANSGNMVKVVIRLRSRSAARSIFAYWTNSYSSEDEWVKTLRRLLRGEPVKKVTSLWALLQNGASMNRTSIGIPQCPYTPMIWWVLS